MTNEQNKAPPSLTAQLLKALNLINVDKDGDGFIPSEAMESVRAVIAKATTITDLTNTFNHYRFIVDVEIDAERYLEDGVGPRDVGVQEALRSEIQSNLESLPGVGSVTVEPAA